MRAGAILFVPKSGPTVGTSFIGPSPGWVTPKEVPLVYPVHDHVVAVLEHLSSNVTVIAIVVLYLIIIIIPWLLQMLYIAPVERHAAPNWKTSINLEYFIEHVLCYYWNSCVFLFSK